MSTANLPALANGSTPARAPHRPARQAPAPIAFTIADMQVMARQMAASRLFPGIENETAAFALMLLCQAEGLHPADAMRRYHIIKGRPSMRADAMLAEFQRQGGTAEWTERTDARVAATFRHPTQAPKGVEIAWDTKRAQAAGVTGNDTWKKYPRQMLTARVISEGVRLVLPGVVAGIYTPEEVQDFEPSPAPAVEARVVEPPARDSRRVEGGSPQLDREFNRWLDAFTADRNVQWADYWTNRLNGAPEDVGDLMSPFQLRGHLHKWLGHPGGKGAVHNHVTRALATARERDPAAFEAEAARYCRDAWRDTRAKVEARLAIEPADQVDERPDDEADPDVDAPGEDEVREREPGED